MRATSLARHLLAFPRLSITDVRFEPGESGDEVLVVSGAVRGRSRCSGCGRKRSRYDRLERRRWRHLDFGAWTVLLEAQLWRVDCPRCGVVVEQVSWADAHSRFTHPFENLVGWLAQRTDKTAISQMLSIAWRTVGAILERVVARYREPVDLAGVRAIGVDELSYRKGQRYLTLVYDLERGRILWSKEGRSAATLATFFDELGPEACGKLEFITMDMSAAYAKAARERLPNATLIYDRFHVQQLVSKALDEVRRAEWRRHRGTDAAEGIKHMRFPLLRNPWDVTQEEHERLAALPKKNQRLYRAYLMKEVFAEIYRSLCEPEAATSRLKEWMGWAFRSRLEPFRKVAATIGKALDGIVAYFETGFTNGPAEGLNNKARLATRQAYGFHSATAVQAMIELRCSGLAIPLPRRSSPSQRRE